MTTESKTSCTSTPGRWSYGRWVLAGLPLLIGATLAGIVCYRIASLPDVGEPFDVQDFVSKSAPVGPNAFIYYKQAEDRLVEEPSANQPLEEAFWKSREKALDGGWGQANKSVRDWLRANEPALELWKRGTECADAFEIRAADVTIGSPAPSNLSLREFLRLGLLEAAHVNAEKAPTDAWPWYRAVLRSSRHAGMHTATLGRMMGIAIHAVTVEPVLRWSARPELTADDLRHALADVLAIDEMTPPLSDNLKAECLLCRATTDASFRGWSELPMRMTGIPERTQRALNMVFANWLSQADRPRFRQTRSQGPWKLFERDSAARANPKFLSPAEIENRCGLANRSSEAVLMTLLIPSINEFFQTVDRERTRQAALALGLALELYHRQHGHFPTALDELVKAGYLQSIPADPFGKGEPFHYRRDVDPQQGAILWSVWVDGTDQNGQIEVARDREGLAGDKIFHIASPRKANP